MESFKVLAETIAREFPEVECGPTEAPHKLVSKFVGGEIKNIRDPDNT